MTQGQVATAGELAQQLLDLAQRQPDTGGMVEGHFLMGKWSGTCWHTTESPQTCRLLREHSQRIVSPV
jgi:hypothetical protein